MRSRTCWYAVTPLSPPCGAHVHRHRIRGSRQTVDERPTTAKNDPDGRSRQRNAWTSHSSKKRIEVMLGIGVERDVGVAPCSACVCAGSDTLVRRHRARLGASNAARYHPREASEGRGHWYSTPIAVIPTRTDATAIRIVPSYDSCLDMTV